MSKKKTAGIIFGSILGLVIVGAIVLFVVEQGVKAEYYQKPVKNASPCWISGSTFDTVKQSKACENYINSGGVPDTPTKQSSDRSPSGLEYNKHLVQPVTEERCVAMKQDALNRIERLRSSPNYDGALRTLNYQIGNLEVYCGLENTNWQTWEEMK